MGPVMLVFVVSEQLLNKSAVDANKRAFSDHESPKKAGVSAI
jgi:hypothetical protein